ncbi:MAG: hypothetical protein J7578_09265 [Chitinophagaceae bacterium]|nr:hypothetical protein [Chitinophagaceae bacterium]
MIIGLAALFLRLSGKTQPYLMDAFYSVDHETVIKTGKAFGRMSIIGKLIHITYSTSKSESSSYRAGTFSDARLRTIQFSALL